MLSKHIKLEVALNGIRWSNNILTELVGNYGHYLSEDVRTPLKEALSHLGRAMERLRIDIYTLSE